ncbi:hypothetical protein RDWZM_006500 [Blomia tropicalis]|uniref:Protein kinase domain-containing protein n=1 Tax=Blomia tropicalis TaxID=40697 RepID=A0A9Q0RLU0_BLOTA|nr:hypothetical protein RDWZM_006500 [Blomia tropicalis]
MTESAANQQHQNRLTQHRLRKHVFIQECTRLSQYMTTEQIIRIQSLSQLSDYDIELTMYNNDTPVAEEFNTITQSHIPGFSSLWRARLNTTGQQTKLQTSIVAQSSFVGSMNQARGLYVHAIKLSELSPEYRQQLCNESLKILRYMSTNRSTIVQNWTGAVVPKRQLFVRIVEIFLDGQYALVVQERFHFESTLQQYLWHGSWNGSYRTIDVKQWAIQLAEIVEVLNQAGIVHRFIRPENILLSNDQKTLKLSSFDFACLYWDSNANQTIPIRPRCLPIECEPNLLTHLPPECFFDGYDGSMDGKEYWKLDLQTYYRIDLNKGINVDSPPPSFRITQPNTVPATIAISSTAFSPNSITIFGLNGYEHLDGDESSMTKYRIDRDQSFTNDPTIVINHGSIDQYFKASIVQPEGTNNQESSSSQCLVKMVNRRQTPYRHHCILHNESSKIMRYISINAALFRYVHRILDIYLIGNCVYIFFESLQQYQSINYILTMGKNIHFPPPLTDRNGPTNNNNNEQFFTLFNVLNWIINLTETIGIISDHGLSHRYVRKEFVFVNEANPQQIKLSHFDMACFVWNPEKSLVVKRTRGIQDELDYNWDHLPPECFENNYDCRLIDVWSVGVLLCFCLTGKQPFNTLRQPFTLELAMEQWTQFKQTNRNSMRYFSDILDLVMVIIERRIQPVHLITMLRTLKNGMDKMNISTDGRRISANRLNRNAPRQKDSIGNYKYSTTPHNEQQQQQQQPMNDESSDSDGQRPRHS